MLDASATATTGNGGKVSAIADMTAGSLAFQGTALARGGVNGGNGGFVETSGHGVDFTGAKIDTSAIGKSGTWLVDPDDLTIDQASAATIDSNLATTDVILQTTATTASGPGVSTSGSGDIIIASDIAWSTAHTLELDAYHSIQFNANVTVGGAGHVVLTTNAASTGGDYSFALGKSLSFTTAADGSQPLTINGNAYTLLTSMDGVSGVGGLAGLNGQSGYYALATGLDSSTNYTNYAVADFFGTLTGLGHTINNLQITGSGSDYVGLFRINDGTIRDLGLSGGTIVTSGNSLVGALAGHNAENNSTAVIQNVYSSVAITGTGGFEIGGLVGENGGFIRNSFTTGTVNIAGGSQVGGLVGLNDHEIDDTYATGAISGDSFIGGLVGQNYNTIKTSLATGLVTATGGNAGGLTGDNHTSYGASVTDVYYDTLTTGQGGAGTGETTTVLQSGTLPSGLSSTVWATGTGLYPYLKSFYPNGAQAISGTSDTSGTSNLITAYAGGQAIGSTSSVGANGYYYILTPGTGLTGTTPIGVSYSHDSNTTLSFTDAPTLTSGNVTGLDLHGQYAEIATSKSLYSDTLTGLNTAFGSSTLSSLMSGLNLTSFGWINYDASGDYTIDQPLTLIRYTDFSSGGNLLSINADITVPASTNVWFFSNKSIAFNANVAADGTSAVTIITNHTSPNGSDYVAGSSPGDYSFLPGKSLTFGGTGGFLNINGNVYTLLNSLSDLTGISGHNGHYALNGSLDLSTTPFTAAVVNSFSGTFTGLGHTISNLNINAPSTNLIGLFGTNTGTVRDIGLIGGTVYGNSYSGALVGENDGLVDDAYSAIDMHVAFRSGGLVGHNLGTVIRSHATGAVTSNGDNGGGVSDMGGLVGWNDHGTISQSYATGTVTGISNTTGGLVAYNNGGTVSDSFATGGVFGNLYAGGLVGYGDANGTITNSFSTGYVHAVTSGGGLVGHFIGTINNAYWDTTTSGTTVGVGDAGGSTITGTGATGLTRATLQNGSLPSGFSSSIWATGNGLYPYLKALFPNGMQSISGYTYASNGTAAPATTLAVYIDGTQVANTTAASGADGYYYLMAQPGTVSSSTHIGITGTTHNASSVGGTAYTDMPTLTAGQVTGFNVVAGQLTYTTGDTAYSTLQTDAQATFGSSLYSALTTALDAAKLKIAASGAFTVDQAISRAGSLLIQSGGDLTLASTGSVTSTASGTAITLAADGSFINNAGSSAVSAANGRWLIYTQAHGNATAAATANSFGGLTAKNYYNDAFNFSTGALASTPNSGNRFVTGYAPTLTVTPDTISLTYNGAVQADTYSLTGYLAGDQANDAITGHVNGLSAPSRNAGTYTLTASGTLASDENYGFTYASGTLTIAKAALTLAAATDTRTYDTTLTSTGTVGVSGLVGGDIVTGTSQAFDSKNAGSRTLNVTGYTVNDGNGGNNYTVTTQTASGTINKAALTAALIGATSKTYDATLTAALTAGNYSLTGLKGSDSVALNDPTSGLYGNANAGAGKTVTASGLALTGTDAGNYTVNGTASGNIGTITARNLTVTADNLGKFSGAVDPLLTYALTSGSLAGSDSLSGSLSRTTGEAPGVYDITQGSLAASANYNVTFVKGAFTVTAVALQNNPVVNPVGNSANNASQPTIKPAPIGLNTSGGPTASDAASTTSSSGQDGGIRDAGSAAGNGDEKATGPNVQAAGQNSSTCASGDGCSNTPYPTNQVISSSISFTSR